MKKLKVLCISMLLTPNILFAELTPNDKYIYVRSEVKIFKELKRSIYTDECPKYLAITNNQGKRNLSILEDGERDRSDLRNILSALEKPRSSCYWVHTVSNPDQRLKNMDYTLVPKFHRDHGTNDVDFPVKTVVTILNSNTLNETTIRYISVKKLVANLKEKESKIVIETKDSGLLMSNYSSNDHTSILSNKKYELLNQCKYEKQEIMKIECD